MAKFNIQIIAKRNGYTDENTKIAEIDICNGHWKYWGEELENNGEKIGLTLNNISKAYNLFRPVKDEIPRYDFKHYEKTGEIIEIGKITRDYDNLLEFINCRIDNLKEDMKKKSWEIIGENSKEYPCFVFFDRSSNDSIRENIVYGYDEELLVKIIVIEELKR